MNSVQKIAPPPRFTNRQRGAQALRRFQRTQADLVGLIFNDVDFKDLRCRAASRTYGSRAYQSDVTRKP